MTSSSAATMGSQVLALVVGEQADREPHRAYHRPRGEDAAQERRAGRPSRAARRPARARRCRRLPAGRLPQGGHKDPRSGRSRCPARPGGQGDEALRHRHDDREQDRRVHRDRRPGRTRQDPRSPPYRSRRGDARSRPRPEDGAQAVDRARRHLGRGPAGGRGTGPAERAARSRQEDRGEGPRRARQAEGQGRAAGAPRHVLPAVERAVAELREHPAAERVSEAGSVRRRCETVHDLDIIATATDPARSRPTSPPCRGRGCSHAGRRRRPSSPRRPALRPPRRARRATAACSSASPARPRTASLFARTPCGASCRVGVRRREHRDGRRLSRGRRGGAVPAPRLRVDPARAA